MNDVLNVAVCYNEYMPADLRLGRLDKDIALMEAADITAIRMGEPAWSLHLPPEAGEYLLTGKSHRHIPQP